VTRWLLVFLLCASGTILLAQAAPDTKTIASRVDHHYNSLHSLSVAFSESYEGMGIHRAESGMLLLRKPGRMRWVYSEPKGKLFVLDGKNAYFYTPGDAQAQRIDAKQLDDLRSPLRFLLGHTELAKELDGLKASAAAADGVYVLTGTPKGGSPHLSRLALSVTGDGTIRAMKIEEEDGSTTNFSFTNEVPNSPVTNADFIFRAPQGVTVVEGLPPV
jgi:outer membrane lipoprotein carrier protein